MVGMKQLVVKITAGLAFPKHYQRKTCTVIRLSDCKIMMEYSSTVDVV